ncbi:MAG TPA: hypothetical protein VGW38_04385, partial [Chloroflexota bacterium]|nr:hypothetical protein [Chloroflexota bacterium]
MDQGLSKRKQRQEQFMALDAGAVADLSPMLLSGAFRLLQSALEQREHGYRVRDNHFATHAPGCIVLLVSGFESWLNEIIEGISHRNTAPRHNEEIRKLAFTTPTAVKYVKAPERATGKKITLPKNLELVLAARD